MERSAFKIFIAVALVFIGQRTYCQTFDSLQVLEYSHIQYVDAASAEDTTQRLNLVVPVSEKSVPLLIWIGGGAWSYVDRNVEMDFARKLARKGIAVASVGHRLSAAVWKDPSLSKGVHHPKHAEDIAASVKWICENANSYGYDTSSIFIGGFSSGAHLAALVAMDKSYVEKQGLRTSIFKGMIPISGTYDIDNYYEVFLNGNRPALAEEHVKSVFGDNVEAFKGASPVSFLDHLSTPMLLMADNNIHSYTRLFEDRIRETEYRDLQVVYAYNLSHAELWKSLSFEESSIYRVMIIDFIGKHG